MNAERFYEARRAEWQALSTLLDRSESNVRRLAPDEIQELSRLYRAATADLALAQRDFPRHRVTAYLNQLVARGHAVVYQGEPLALRRLRHFVVAGFPRTVRQTGPFILAAALFFIVPALLAGLVTNWNPDAARWLLPPQVETLIPMIEEQELWTDIPSRSGPIRAASSCATTSRSLSWPSRAASSWAVYGLHHASERPAARRADRAHGPL